jgi:hypothetical protein
MSDERTGVSVSFHVMAFHKHYVALRRLAEMVPTIGGDGHDDSSGCWRRV